MSDEAKGSPAHAWMVPASPKWPISARRFPRPRGDGPLFVRMRLKLPAVPPPTRGWSPRLHVVRRPSCGSPAHAGMVPWLNSIAVIRPWFPRPRGDGPTAPRIASSRLLVPPPTRGWSLTNQVDPAFAAGSPAHAGMVPAWARCSFARPPVPPPTRGWSRTSVASVPSALGSPAHAGMVPFCAARRLLPPWFPRPRGDGPCVRE